MASTPLVPLEIDFKVRNDLLNRLLLAPLKLEGLCFALLFTIATDPVSENKSSFTCLLCVVFNARVNVDTFLDLMTAIVSSRMTLSMSSLRRGLSSPSTGSSDGLEN
jgi:hypothetical protein